MKVVFILVVTAFTISLSRELPRHRHKKKFPQRRETIQDAYIGPKSGTQHNRLFPEYGTNFRVLDIFTIVKSYLWSSTKVSIVVLVPYLMN